MRSWPAGAIPNATPLRWSPPWPGLACVLVRSKSGTIGGWELQIALEAMGQNPQEDDIKAIIVQLGAEKTGMLGQLEEE